MPLPEVALTDVATSLDIRATLAALAPEQRAILVLRDVDGLSEVEVARALRVPVGTVKSRAHRARAAFRGRWES
jgi:RNA polymerase sigma-70 factor (ECF subfamily)